mmetsp:Transcript_12660/g.31882  ORF Transcript_12660/g.31882 Transcript_12660/m.31882 type:complete len:103 (+) Transcript_12660:608-916(+)
MDGIDPTMNGMDPTTEWIDPTNSGWDRWSLSPSGRHLHIRGEFSKRSLKTLAPMPRGDGSDSDALIHPVSHISILIYGKHRIETMDKSKRHLWEVRLLEKDS